MAGLLDKINYSRDLHLLDAEELGELAEEIREYITECVSVTGGHLASNLGTVEATLAMHYVFDFEKDRLFWDVGHQCYTHKILTGRKEGLRKLRQRGAP
jgi:1-deoxy-D-xylulose-5-phosphate synthase